MNDNSLWQLTLVRFREFIREPEAIFWTFIFPILLTAGLGLAFRNKPADVVKVGTTAQDIAARLKTEKGLAVELTDRASGEQGAAHWQDRDSTAAGRERPRHLQVRRHQSGRPHRKAARRPSPAALFWRDRDPMSEKTWCAKRAHATSTFWCRDCSA